MNNNPILLNGLYMNNCNVPNPGLSNGPQGISMISLNSSDIHLSQASRIPTDPLLETYPILSNLLQPQATARSGNTETKKAANIQHGSYPHRQVEINHNYQKTNITEEAESGKVLLTINLTNYTKGIDVKDICGVVLLLKKPTPLNDSENKPTEIIHNYDLCKTEMTVTEPTIEDVDETKPDITLLEPIIEVDTKPEITIENSQKQKDYFQCESCHKGFSSPKVLQTHMKRYHDSRVKKFKCPSCSKFFLSQTMMRRHLRMVHYIKCDYCEGSFETTLVYKIHLKEMHKDVNYMLSKPYFCEVCNTEFGMKDVFIRHLREHVPFVCCICAEGFSTKEEYKAHENTHPAEFFCPECNKGFRSKVSLKAHESVHNDPFEFICNKCNKGFKAKSTLRQHMFTHFSNKNFMCDVCSKMFRTQHSVLMHKKVVHAKIRMYQCEKCDKRFSGKSNLAQHVRVMHTKLKPYQCEYCGAQFARRDYVINHSKIHNKPEKPGIGFIHRRKECDPLQPKESPPVDCPICGKTLKSLVNLKLHLRSTHARLRRFKCKFCGLMFLHKTSQIRHEKAHDADPIHKFVCPICWRRMETKEQLDAHMGEHNNRPKRHTCDVCGETFSRRMLLDNHVFSNHTSQEDLIKKEMEIMNCLTQAVNSATSD